MITELEQLQERLKGVAKQQVEKEVQCLQTHRERMDYGAARKRGEPLGSGAVVLFGRAFSLGGFSMIKFFKF